MRDALDDDVIIVADPGTPTPFLSAQYELRRPGRTTVIPRAHGGLGYAIPGVVGAWYAGGGRRVVGMTGDGSFGMSVGELETITRLGLPIVIIQCSNGTFGWIKELQHLYHDDRYFGVDFNPVDYAAIARGFGFCAAQVTDPNDVDRAVRDAIADGRPYFLDVVTESPITETPPVAAWTEAEAMRPVSAGDRQ
jgi:acetolactate synthase I/II/III large subunit